MDDHSLSGVGYTKYARLLGWFVRNTTLNVCTDLHCSRVFACMLCDLPLHPVFKSASYPGLACGDCTLVYSGML